MQEPSATATTFCWRRRWGAMGLETDLARLRLKGLKPLLLGAAASLFSRP